MAKMQYKHDLIIKELQRIYEINVDNKWIKKYDNQTFHAMPINHTLTLRFGQKNLAYLSRYNYLRGVNYDMLSDKYLEKILQGAIEAKKRGYKSE